MRIIPLLAEEGWRVAPGWSVRPKCVPGLLLRLRPIALALRGPPLQRPFSTFCAKPREEGNCLNQNALGGSMSLRWKQLILTGAVVWLISIVFVTSGVNLTGRSSNPSFVRPTGM